MPPKLESGRLAVDAAFSVATEVFQGWDVYAKALNHNQPWISTLKQRSIEARSA